MRTNLLLITMLLFVAGIAHAVAQPLPQNLKLVGEAQLKVFWFDIYQARLENAQGLFDSIDSPQLLTLTYQRNISKQELVKETEKQWRSSGLAEQVYQPWLERIHQIWPDIRQQDSLAFYRDRMGTGHFYYNQAFIGALDDPQFSRAFLAIWLAEDSAFPALSRALKGR